MYSILVVAWNHPHHIFSTISNNIFMNGFRFKYINHVAYSCFTYYLIMNFAAVISSSELSYHIQFLAFMQQIAFISQIMMQQ